MLYLTQGLVAQKDSGPAWYLLKSEPHDFSIDDVAVVQKRTERDAGELTPVPEEAKPTPGKPKGKAKVWMSSSP